MIKPTSFRFNYAIMGGDTKQERLQEGEYLEFRMEICSHRTQDVPEPCPCNTFFNLIHQGIGVTEGTGDINKGIFIIIFDGTNYKIRILTFLNTYFDVPKYVFLTSLNTYF